MPARELIHTRNVVCQGYRRGDGLFDIEGSMTDTSVRGTEMFFKDLRAGERIHAMRLRLAVDAQLVIHEVEVRTDAAPTAYCGDSNALYQALVGMTISPGFTRRVRALLGGTRGCTHLTELLDPVATTAVQTFYADMREKTSIRAAQLADGPMAPPLVVNTCQAYRSEGPAMRLIWPLERRPSTEQIS